MPSFPDRTHRSIALRLLAALTGAALLIAAAPVEQRATAGTIIATGDGAHVLGSPAAKIKLTEYISYTCPHCAHFSRESEATLLLTFVASGKGSVEVRPFIRNAVDLAVSLLVNCGDTRHFRRLHDTFLLKQDEWMAKVAAVGDGPRARWDNGPMSTRMRAIAGDLDFYAIMETAGYSRGDADRCLNDEAAMHQLAEQTDIATKAGVDSTPSFAIDGIVLTGTHDWATLKPQLLARM